MARNEGFFFNFFFLREWEEMNLQVETATILKIYHKIWWVYKVIHTPTVKIGQIP